MLLSKFRPSEISKEQKESKELKALTESAVDLYYKQKYFEICRRKGEPIHPFLELDQPQTLSPGLTKKLRALSPAFANVVALVNKEDFSFNAAYALSKKEMDIILFTRKAAGEIIEITSDSGLAFLSEGIKHTVNHELSHPKTEALRFSKTAPEYTAEFRALSKCEDPVYDLACFVALEKIATPELSFRTILEEQLIDHWAEYCDIPDYGRGTKLIAKIRRIELPLIILDRKTIPFPFAEEAREMILKTAEQLFKKYLIQKETLPTLQR